MEVVNTRFKIISNPSALTNNVLFFRLLFISGSFIINGDIESPSFLPLLFKFFGRYSSFAFDRVIITFTSFIILLYFVITPYTYDTGCT